MTPTISSRTPPKRTQRKANCETIRHSGYGCGINKGNAKKRLISYIAEARCNGCAIHKKNYSAVCVPSSIRGCYRKLSR